MIRRKEDLDAFRGSLVRTNITTTSHSTIPIIVTVGRAGLDVRKLRARPIRRCCAGVGVGVGTGDTRGIPVPVPIPIPISVPVRTSQMPIRPYPRRLPLPARLQRTTRAPVRIRITPRDILCRSRNGDGVNEGEGRRCERGAACVMRSDKRVRKGVMGARRTWKVMLAVVWVLLAIGQVVLRWRVRLRMRRARGRDGRRRRR